MVDHGERHLSGALACLAGCSNMGTGSTVILVDGTFFSYGLGARTATFRIANDGYIYAGDNGSYIQQYAWLLSGAAGDYQAYATVTAGSVIGTTGSWVALSSTADWSIADGNDDGIPESATMIVQIRDTATSTVRATATIDLSALKY